MPTYQYACTNPACGERFERVQAFTDPAVSECPVCGQAVRKVYGSVGVVFKGSGFYRNDSRAGEKGSDALSAASSSKESSSVKESSSKESSSSDSGSSSAGSSSSGSSSSDSSSSGSSGSSTSSGSSSGSGSSSSGSTSSGTSASKSA